MIFKNKKAMSWGIGLFRFFFGLMIVSGILFFMLTALPAILYDYGIQYGVTVNQNIVDLGISNNESQENIEALASSYTNLYNLADYAFIFFMVSMFIESVIAASRVNREGIFTFLGLITLGNIFLIFILSYAIHINDWFLNNFVYNILTISIATPFASWFFNNSYFIGSLWYCILLLVNIIDFKALGSKFTFLSKNKYERDKLQ